MASLNQYVSVGALIQTRRRTDRSTSGHQPTQSESFRACPICVSHWPSPSRLTLTYVLVSSFQRHDNFQTMRRRYRVLLLLFCDVSVNCVLRLFCLLLFIFYLTTFRQTDYSGQRYTVNNVNKSRCYFYTQQQLTEEALLQIRE